MKTQEPTDKDWKRFVTQGLQEWNDINKTNVIYDFKKMCKQYGLSYLYWLELQYRMYKEHQHITMQELIEWNGNPPIDFFNRF